MLENLHDPIERARDATKTPGVKSAKKRQINGIIPDIMIDVRNAILNHHSKHLSDVVRPGRDHLRHQDAFTA